MLVWLCRIIAAFPLSQVQTLGAWIGKLSLLLDHRLNHVAETNLRQSGLCHDTEMVKSLRNTSRIETGKSLLETFYLWGSATEKLLPLVRSVDGWALVQQAQQVGTGIIFLTPHLGCFEITSIYYGSQQPITVLFRPPKLKWLESILHSGRQKGLVDLAPANAAGVKKLLQALKRGEAIGILPDQIPKKGEGEWAPFFGKPAYTMSLASKLAVKTGATVIMAFGERLAHGEGYHIHLSKIDDISTPALLNHAIEQQIAQCPSQYLWQYNRYKQRRYAVRKLQKNTSGPQS